MLSDHLQEPAIDVAAQVGALIDPGHPKDAVFLSPRNAIPPRLPANVLVKSRGVGTLLTTDIAKLHKFSGPDLSDDDMASILGLPESKSEITGEYVALQARDGFGRVITEMAASVENLPRAVSALMSHVPADGELFITTPWVALLRRLELVSLEKKALH